MQSSQSQDFRTLARLKRKRREPAVRQQPSHGTAPDPLTAATSHAHSMASFIQSALGREGGDREQEGWGEDEGSTSRPTISSTSVTRGQVTNRGGKRKRGSTAKRRPRLGVRSKRGRLSAAAVRWPGFEEEGEPDSSSSDIQGYSDSEEEGDRSEGDTRVRSPLLPDAPSQSDDIQGYLDQTTESVRDAMVWAGPRQVVQRRRKGRGSGRTMEQWAVATSTPSHRRGRTDSLAERIIEDFESPSSEDDAPNHSHPPSPSSLLHLHPITVATATRTRTRPLIGRGLPVSPIDCASTPEDMRITTPPSSPEVVASVSDFNRTKASDWIKQVQLESAESIGGDPNDTAKTPHHCLHQHQCQSESSKRAGRTKKFIPGGLAEQLQRVSRSEASEVTVWEHRVRRLEGKDADTDGCVTVHVLSLANSHSLFIARCQALKGSSLLQARRQTGRQTREQPLGAEENSTQDWSQFSTQSQSRHGRADIVQDCPRQGPAVESDGVSDLESGYHGMETRPQSPEENMLHSAESGAVWSGMRPEDGDGTGTVQELLQIRECGSAIETALANATDGTAQPHPSSRTEQEVTVLFSLRWAGLLSLCVGSCVRIRPPWQCLSISTSTLPAPSLHRHVLLCTNFCQSLGHVPLPFPGPAPPSPLPPCRQKGVEGVYGLVSPEKTYNTPHSLLIKSPVKALQPLRLFSDQKNEARTPINAHHSIHEATIDHHGNGSTMVTTPPLEGPNISDVSALTSSIIQGRPREIQPCSLAEAMEHAHCGLVSFTARVHRVYRRKLPGRRDGDELTSPLLSLRQSFLQRAKLQQAGPPVAYKLRWVLLVCDTSRVFSEIQLTDETQPPWSDLVKSGEGRAYHFANVRVARRINPSRNPGVFSLLSSLRVGPPRAGSSETPPLECGSPPCSGPSPSFCYTLLCQPDSRAVPYPGTEQLPRALASPGKEEQPQALSPLTTAPPTAGDSELGTSGHRTSFLARVLLIQSEVAKDTDGEGNPTLQEPRPLCGYFLFVVTNAGAGVADGNCCQATLPVYLKPSFSVAGLWKVLSTPGSKVMLRDVLYRGNGTPEDHYCMDACSMVIPVRAGDMEPGPNPYPRRSFTTEELHILNSLSSPPLPPLTQDTAKQGALVCVTGVVVGVAEDQAYSWPACSTCGNNRLVSLDDSESSELYCDECEKAALSPSIHMQLTVFVHCPLLDSHTVSIQLLQTTIHTLLPVTEASIRDGFDIHCVLDRAVSLHACYITAARDTPDGTQLLCLKEVDVQFKD